MAFGPGKYDDVCTKARTEAGATGLVMLVINGKHGHGFSAQVDAATLAQLPEMLEQVARSLRNDRALAQISPPSIQH